jgi:hypothetical protein
MRNACWICLGGWNWMKLKCVWMRNRYSFYRGNRQILILISPSGTYRLPSSLVPVVRDRSISNRIIGLLCQPSWFTLRSTTRYVRGFQVFSVNRQIRHTNTTILVQGTFTRHCLRPRDACGTVLIGVTGALTLIAIPNGDAK